MNEKIQISGLFRRFILTGPRQYTKRKDRLGSPGGQVFGLHDVLKGLEKLFHVTKAFNITYVFALNEGYTCDTLIHPFNLNRKNEHSSEHVDRPEWSVYGRMAEKTENVAFRRKFFDWPDPVDLKVKTVEAKVHAQVMMFSSKLPRLQQYFIFSFQSNQRF